MALQFSDALPDDKEPLGEIMERSKTAFAKRLARRQAEMWLPVRIPEHRGLPFGIAMVGDMHIDNPGCDLQLLENDLRTIADTSGMYGIFIGDGTDNWVGRLMSLYAKHSVSRSDGLRLLKWAMHGSGVDWLAWVMGNHDLWNDGATVLDLLGKGTMYVPEWEARLNIKAAGQSWKVHCAHNFKGTSQLNPTHGLAKAAFMTTPAELLVAGHLHTSGMQTMEIPGHDRVVHLARARGYKCDDEYAVVNGFPENQHSASVLAIFDPRARSAAQRIQLFYDLDAGAEYLAAIRAHRSRADAPKKQKRKAPAKKKASKPKLAPRKPAGRRKVTR